MAATGEELNSAVSILIAFAINNTVRQCINRLSDLLSVMARVLNRGNGGTERQWDRSRKN